MANVVDQSRCETSVGCISITNLFADDAVLLSESLEVVLMVLEMLHKD